MPSGTRPSLARSGLPGSGGTSVASSCHRSSAGVDGKSVRWPGRPGDLQHHFPWIPPTMIVGVSHGVSRTVFTRASAWPTKKAGCKSLLLPEPAAGQKKDRRDPIPTAGVAGGSAIFQPPGSCFPAAGPVWGFIATSVSKTVTAVGADSLSRVASQPNRGIAPCQTPPGTVAAATSVFQRRLMPPPEAESPVLSDRTVPSWIGFRGIVSEWL